MLRRALLAASGSDRARRLISSAPLTRGVVNRYVAGDTTAQVTQVLSQLTAGPDPDEQSRGLSSAIPPGLSVMLEGVDGSKAIVDIEGTDPGPATEEARLATAQVVLTLTSLPQVDSVLLKRNGQPHAVLPDGELTEQPLTREDVVSLLQQ